MPEFIPRTLVVLTAIVAVIALFIGIRDYVAIKNKARPVASPGAKSVVQPDTVIARKKTVRAKKSRAQLPATETNAAVADAAEDATTRPLIREVLAKVESAPGRGRTAEVQAVLNAANSRSSSHTCTPLPNSTKPEDVDAIYYQGWAREYGCGLD